MLTNRGIYYELRGNDEGPVLVMVRGLGRFALHWGRVLDELEPHFRLLVLDNRGVGRSAPARFPFAISDMADDVASVMDHARVARAHLFGISLGGMVALRFAVDHGGRLDRLVLGATTAGGAAKVTPRFGPLIDVLRAKIRSLRDGVTAEARLVLSEELLAAEPEVLEEWLELAETHPPAPRAVAYQMLAVLRHDVSRELDRITAPTLVISAEHDRLVPAENSRILARKIPRAELAWLPGPAHDLTTEHPTRMASLLRDFLLPPVR